MTDQAPRSGAVVCGAYLEEHAGGSLLLIGEAAGYRGARVSGLPFTSERQLTGSGPAEATATVVHRVLAELELDALCWNLVPTHPGTESSNRRPTRLEVELRGRFSRSSPKPPSRRRRQARGQSHQRLLHPASVPWRSGRIPGWAATVLRRRTP